MSVDETPHGTVVVTPEQTAGRGQRGNGWESAPGQNLTFSVVLRPDRWPASRQFELSMAVSVGVARALSAAMPGEQVRIKWPNDIYVGNGKMVGMLLENTLSGCNIDRCIAGIGINVNQRRFVSDAPNPVSMSMLTGQTYDLDVLLRDVCASVLEAVDGYMRASQSDTGILTGPDAVTALSRTYHAQLWRNDGGMYRWLDTSTLQMFSASIHHVDADGPLHLTDSAGCRRRYLFKQVAAVIKE